MTQDEKLQWQREVAAGIFVRLVEALPIYEGPSEGQREEMSDAARAAEAASRNRQQVAAYASMARMAERAFTAAGAWIAEAELHGPPVDDEGNELDARALDPKCIHGNKATDPCPWCDARDPAAVPYARDNEATVEALGRVLRLPPDAETVAAWSDDEARLAAEWAAAAYMRAGDNVSGIPPMPAHLSAYL